MTVEDAGKRPGKEALRRLLAHAQWSPEHLGDRLNALAGTLGLRAQLSRCIPGGRWIDSEANGQTGKGYVNVKYRFGSLVLAYRGARRVQSTPR